MRELLCGPSGEGKRNELDFRHSKLWFSFLLACFLIEKKVFCFYSLVSKIYISNRQECMDSVRVMLHIHNCIFSNELLCSSILKSNMLNLILLNPLFNQLPTLSIS